MSIDEILGWATVILDTFGVRNVISVILLIAVAGWAYDRFIRKD